MDEAESGFMSACFAAWLHKMFDVFYNLGILIYSFLEKDI